MRILDLLLGKPLASHEEEEHKVGSIVGVPMLGLDALASSAYGPEAALTVLIPAGLVGAGYLLPITMVILAILILLYLSYRQTIRAYPNGGGSYTVAKANYGPPIGLIAAAALLLDYLLAVAVGISAGVGALISALPEFHGHELPLCLVILAVITVVNLRGVRESGLAFVVPTYLFIGAMLLALAVGAFHAFATGFHPKSIAPLPEAGHAAKAASAWLLMRAFASGCTAMTGVEAVSNGVQSFAQPRERNAQRTLTIIVGVLGVLLLGVALLCRAYGIAAVPPASAHYQSVISQLLGAVFGRGVLYFIGIGSVLAVLALSANTGFAGFPRLCRLLALDDYLPHAFAGRGRRLVYSAGIACVAVLSGLLLIAFGGITDRLIPLFAIGAFLAFTISQASMVVHWRRVQNGRLRLLLNAAGAIATGTALVIVLIAKFAEGAWVTVLLIPVLYVAFVGVHHHYRYVQRLTEATHEIDLSKLEPPVVVVPVKRWDTTTEKALRFAISISDEVIGLHVAAEEDDAAPLRDCWTRYVELPVQKANRPVPRLLVVRSEFRRLYAPFFRGIGHIESQYPGRRIAVIVPELVEARWWQYLMHNQRATVMKAALLFRPDTRIVVINVPWYLEPRKRP